MVTEAGTGKARDSAEPVTDHVPFLMLGLDLPPAPLFKDALEKVIIPQVCCACCPGHAALRGAVLCCALGLNFKTPPSRRTAVCCSIAWVWYAVLPLLNALRQRQCACLSCVANSGATAVDCS